MDLLELFKQLDAVSVALGLGGLGGVAIMLRKLYAIFAADGLQIKGTEIQADLITQLNEQTQRLSASNRMLGEEVETLRNENVELRLTVGKLQSENSSLAAKVNELTIECARLRSTITDLIDTVQTLRSK